MEQTAAERPLNDPAHFDPNKVLDLAGRLYRYTVNVSALGYWLALDHDFARHDPLLMLRQDGSSARLRFIAPPPQTVLPLLRRFAPECTFSSVRRAIMLLPGSVVTPLFMGTNDTLDTKD